MQGNGDAQKWQNSPWTCKIEIKYDEEQLLQKSGYKIEILDNSAQFTCYNVWYLSIDYSISHLHSDI